MPLSNLDDYQLAVQRMVRDGADVLDAPDFDQYIQDAVRRLSRVEPRKVVADIAGSGAYDYDLPTPYDAEFSSVQQVEYPAGQREPSIVDALDWTVYASPSGAKLRFLATSPATGKTIRVTFTAMHVVDAASSTVPSVREDAVTLLAAALACEALAAHYSNTGDSIIQADAVDHKSKASEYAQRAKRFMALATDLLPVPAQGESAAAGAEISLGEDVDFLTHRRR